MTSTLSSISVSKALRRAAGLLFGLALAVGVLELGLRAIEVSPWWRVLPAVHAQFDGPDPELGYGHRPNVEGLWLRENRTVVRINALGLRDRPPTVRPAAGTVRIAVAGDSITEAMQVDESDMFTQRAEQKLASSAPPVEILNFGLSGALPLQQLLFVAKRGLPLGVDAAVFVFSAGDLLNRYMRDASVLPAYVEATNGDLKIGYDFRNRRSHLLADRWIGRVFFWLVDHSRVANAFYIRAKSGFQLADQTKAARVVAGSACDDVHANLVDQEKLWADGEPAWAGRRLSRFLADVPKLLNGKPALFIMSGFGQPTRACPAVAALRNRVIALAQAKVEAAGIGFVDLDSAVLAIMDGDESGFRRLAGFGAHLGYGHLNVWGHEIYARVLTGSIRARFSQLFFMRANAPSATR